jgi:hypothetical protein
MYQFVTGIIKLAFVFVMHGIGKIPLAGSPFAKCGGLEVALKPSFGSSPKIRIDLCTLTKATLPRPSAFSAIKKSVYSTLTPPAALKAVACRRPSF